MTRADMKHTDQYHGLVPGFQGNSARLLSHSHAADEEFCLVLVLQLLYAEIFV